MGNRGYAFYVRAGVTWMRTTVKDFQQSVNDVAHTDLVASDPKIRYRGPIFDYMKDAPSYQLSLSQSELSHGANRHTRQIATEQPEGLHDLAT